MRRRLPLVIRGNSRRIFVFAFIFTFPLGRQLLGGKVFQEERKISL
jgi:hypothetical protein